MNAEIKKTIEYLLGIARLCTDSNDTLKHTQAALNLAHLNQVLTNSPL